MPKSSKYESKQPDEHGVYHYTEDENAVWGELFQRQQAIMPGRVCDEFLEGLHRIGLPEDRVPQPEEVSRVLRKHTGFELAPVPALIPFGEFFKLLSERKFPAATFIRTREDMDYLQEPDVFHEIFGHTPLLTHPGYAEFTEAYGKLGLNASKADRVMLARLYWFTVEFGLVKAPDGGVRTYGGGINSSPGETVYAVESETPQRLSFDPVEALRTPYRIDIYQPIYFVLDSLDRLLHLAHEDVMDYIRQARELGEHPPAFPPKEAEAPEQAAAAH